MLFNTFQFALFFIIVYSLYLKSNHRWQNAILLVASYIFYGSWDWRFLSLIVLSTILDFYCGAKIYNSPQQSKRKTFLILSIFGNLTILGFFKYFNFFASNLQTLLYHFNVAIQPRFLNILLPVGISFYTFQTMSYTIDIYRKKLEPTTKFFDFALFVAFFPQLVAGPIERAKHLLPQILSPRKVTLDKFYQGLYLIFWGLFMKTFVADNLAQIVDPVFTSSVRLTGIRVLFALYAFAFQIFCDFAGYSNIARGLGKVMGFDIMVNFNLPYLATNPREFWQRWHISLSTWLKDYLYIPLGGSKGSKLKTYRNLIITMLLGGLWHGAAWTFILWGAYQGTILIIHRLFSPLLAKIPQPKSALAQKAWFALRVVFFFHVTCLGWLIFRAESLAQIGQMIHALVFSFQLMPPIAAQLTPSAYLFAIVFWLKIHIKDLPFHTAVLLIIQWYQYKKNDLLAVFNSSTFIKVIFYYTCFLSIFFFGVAKKIQFIYFQF
ncbi:MAG: MBOAT family protein [Candidatus Omnitrophica bacterium]|nr:MBOAT family protein [Candidatus Omnitrophota bacterium]